ncbi:unnamed protein product [Closterium sp. NIES-64]|nr:unnamed protein product [Closterium sp. NIES-64]
MAVTLSSASTAQLRLARTAAKRISVPAATAACHPAAARLSPAQTPVLRRAAATPTSSITVATAVASREAAPLRLAAAPPNSYKLSDGHSGSNNVRLRSAARCAASTAASRGESPFSARGLAPAGDDDGAARFTGRPLPRRFSRAAAAQASPVQAATADESEGDTWQLKLLYDGDCPICMREVDFLRGRNKEFGTLKFVDIAAGDYSADENAGVQYEAAMGSIHGIRRDGTVVTGVEAFREFYEAVGLGWVYAITKFPPVGALADAVYEIWAKYRLPLSGRPSLQAVIEERRRNKLGVQGCKEEEEECDVKF